MINKIIFKAIKGNCVGGCFFYLGDEVDCPMYSCKEGYMFIEDTEQEPFNITSDDVISIKRALTILGISTYESNDLANTQILSMIRHIIDRVKEGIFKPIIPEYETPEQYKLRTGTEWPDDALVWVRHIKDNLWSLTKFKIFKNSYDYEAVIAIKIGPPPAAWQGGTL